MPNDRIRYQYRTFPTWSLESYAWANLPRAAKAVYVALFYYVPTPHKWEWFNPPRGDLSIRSGISVTAIKAALDRLEADGFIIQRDSVMHNGRDMALAYRGRHQFEVASNCEKAVAPRHS